MFGNTPKTYISIILDRSGSMWSIRDSAQEALNGFVDSQRGKEGEVDVQLIQFDNQYEVSIPRTSVDNFPTVTLEPRGGTALLDAIGKTITSVKNDTQPGEKIVIAIITDGQENASREYSNRAITELLKEVQGDRYKWDVLFLAANQDAIATASQYGISTSQALNFNANARGVARAMAVMGTYLDTTRLGVPMTLERADLETENDPTDTTRSIKTKAPANIGNGRG